MGVRTRAAYSRELIAKGRRPAVVARVLQLNRSGLYRTPKRRPPAARRAVTDPVDRLIVEVARTNPTDGTRMVAALTRRELGRQVNRTRAQRVMREQRLLQRHRPLRRRRRPGFFRVECPDQLWHLDRRSVWVAEHGWTYLNAAIDCCTREIVGWSLELRCRAEEASALVDGALTARTIAPGTLTLGTDNRSAFTRRGFRARRAEHSVTHLPRPRIAGLHRKLVREAEGAARLAPRVRNARTSEKGARRLHRPLPPPPTLRPRLPHADRGTPHLGRWTTTTENSALTCRARRDPGQRATSCAARGPGRRRG